jgi:hypothetical protein
MLTLLDSENADRDLTSQVTCLTHTPSATQAMHCQAVVFLGDGAKDLDGSGGDFEVTVTVGGVVMATDPEYFVLTDETRCCYTTWDFIVPANNQVLVKVKSPNAADIDVDVTCYLYDLVPGDVAALSKGLSQLSNVSSFAKSTGVLTIMDTDGTTPLYERTRTDNTSTLDWTAITDV